jgi:hypothetical protein
MQTVKGFLSDKTFQGFHPQGKFHLDKAVFFRQGAATQAFQFFGGRVFRVIGNPKVFPSSAFDCGLEQFHPAADNEIQGFYHRALAAGTGKTESPVHRGGNRLFIVKANSNMICGDEQGIDACHVALDCLHVVKMMFAVPGFAFCGKDMGRDDAVIFDRGYDPAVTTVSIGIPVKTFLSLFKLFYHCGDIHVATLFFR